MFDHSRFRNDLIALGLLAATVFVGLSLVSYDPADPPAHAVYPVRAETTNLCGNIGASISHGLRSSVGISAYFILISMIILDIRLFSRQESRRPIAEVFGWGLLLTSLCVCSQLLIPGFGNGPVIGSGGYLGATGVALLENQFSIGGTMILLMSAAIAGLVLTSDLHFMRVLSVCTIAPVKLAVAAGGRSVGWFERRKEKAELDRRGALSRRETNVVVAVNEPPEDEEDEAEEETVIESTARPPIKVNPPVTARTSREAILAQLDADSDEELDRDFELPTPDLLEQPEEFPYELLAKKARIAAVTLEKTFREFGLNVRVVEIDTGPVITQFELELEAGLRLSKVTALADDLAIALRVPSVRVVAPIPGKNTVGVEVPNEKQVMVRMRELIESCEQEAESNRIPIFLGKDVSGRPMVVDMTKMPHLLIAGRTGTGKSVCLNTLILSMLMTRSPEQVKMLMIDPKMVELSPYKRIPHLMHPVITDMKKAEAVLAWAVDKMEERYDLLARAGVRHLDGYNQLGKEKLLQRMEIDEESAEADDIPDKMPYIVIIADEMADMMMTSGKDVEGHIIRLAQKSRAVGIHLVLATQKPTVDVITGLIKSNLPARISFQVASRSDSRVVLDEMGADRLLGNGDMLYLAPGTSKLTRAQGTFISDDEVNTIIDFFSDQEPQYSDELAKVTVAGASNANPVDAMRKRDELYEQAVDIVVREGRGSVSLLQRCLGIGYGRGARLIDYMAEDGIVGDYNGSQAREVLYTPEQWEALQAGHELEDAVAQRIT